MLWQVLLFISIISYSFSIVWQRVLIKNNKAPMGFAIFFQLCTALFIGLIAVLLGFHIPNLLPILPVFILTIIIYTLANICVFRSLSRIEASQFTILFVTRGIWTILTATIFLHESFSLVYMLGTLLIFVSVFLVSYKKNGFHLNTGSVYALAAGFLFGVGYVCDAYNVRSFSSPITYSFLDFVLPGIILFFLFHSSVKKQVRQFKKVQEVGKLVLLCFVYAIFGITILLAYKYGGQASVIGAISQSTTIVIVLLAIVFLKERSEITKKLFAAIIACIGILLLQ